MLLEIFLRSVVLVLCAGVIATALSLSKWAVTPVIDKVRGVVPQARIAIEPVGLIESGRIKQVESRVLASRVRHRVDEIFKILAFDQKEDLKTLQELQFHLIPVNEGFVTESRIDQLELITGDPVEFKFQAEVFKFDVAGFATYVANKLDKSDKIKTMLELSDDRTRMFLEIDRANGEKMRIVDDGPATLSAALDHTACAVVLGYLAGDAQYEGMTAHQFCVYVTAVQQYHKFVRNSAAKIKNEQPYDPSALKAVIAEFEAAPLGETRAPVIDLMLAALFRLDNRHDVALDRLIRAERNLPDNAFVKTHLAAWKKEKAAKEKEQEQFEETIRTAQGRSSDTSTIPTISETYSKIRMQAGLRLINYPEMVEFAESEPGHPVRIAVYGTGFTPVDPPARPPSIMPVENFSDDPDGTDGNGYGNMVTHLLAALLPYQEIEIVPYKVLDKSGRGVVTTVLSGLEKAMTSDIDINAFTLGFPMPQGSRIFEDVFTALDEVGIETFAASGNEGPETKRIPAVYENVVSVGGINLDGALASFSPGPEAVDILAPAIDISSTKTGLDIESWSGTSFSAIIATALFATCRRIDPQLDRERFLTLLRETSKPGADGKPDLIDARALIEKVAENP